MEKAGKGDVIGKIEIPVKTLSDQKQHEQWYPLASADANQYIAGEVHLKLEYKPQDGCLLVKVVAAKNLAPKGIGGLSNPYIRLQLGKRKKKTKTVNKTVCPTFNDIFEFKVKPEDPTELILTVWHKDMLNSVFMGKIVIPYSEFEPNFLYDGWYVVTDNQDGQDIDDEESGASLSDSCDGSQAGSHRKLKNTSSLLANTRRLTLMGDIKPSRSSSDLAASAKEENSCGDIRIVLKYTEETVLPDQEYEELLDVLMKDKLDIIRALGQVTNEKEDVGRCLSQIFETKGKGEDLIICLTCDEVEKTKDPSVLFRANSLATKAFDYYLKLVGLPYLHQTLQDVVKEVYATKKACEVDPTRLEKTDDIEKNFANLTAFEEDICSRIFGSIDGVPQLVLILFLP